MVMPCVSTTTTTARKKNEETKHAFCVCVCVTDGGAMIVWKSLAVDGVGHSLLLLLLHLLPCLSLSVCVMSGGFD